MLSTTDEVPKEAHCDIPGVRREPYFDGNFTFNTGRIMSFKPFDYTLFALSLFIPTVIGFYQAWRSDDRKDFDNFMLAKRRMGYFPVGLSLLASFLSAITMSGAPAAVYNRNIQHIWVGAGFLFICAVTAHIFVPMFYELRVKSCYKYLQMRFNKHVRTIGSCLFSLHAIVYMSLVLYTPSEAISGVTGLDTWGTVVSVTLVCTIYVTIGGIKAVIWADTFQMFLIYVTVFIALMKANAMVGVNNMIESAKRTGRSTMFDSTTLSHLIGSSFGFLGIYTVNNTQIHRVLTCTTLKTAKMAVWMNFPGQVIFLTMCVLLGLYMSALYENCDPIQARIVESSAHLTPLFMQDILSDTPGLMGIFLAGISSATLSTVSSCLNSISMVIIEDVIRVYFHENLREDRERLVSQIISVIFGFICLEITIVASQLGSDVLTVAVEIHGSMHGPMLGLFSLGMFFPWANSKGAVAGVCSSLAFNIAFLLFADRNAPKQPLMCVSNCDPKIFRNKTTNDLATIFTTTALPTKDSHFMFSPVWLSLVSFTTCVIIGIAVSFITGFRDPQDVDPRLIVPVFDVIFPFYYLPESTREYLRFGIDHENKYEKARQKNQPMRAVSKISNADSDTPTTQGQSVQQFQTWETAL